MIPPFSSPFILPSGISSAAQAACLPDCLKTSSSFPSFFPLLMLVFASGQASPLCFFFPIRKIERPVPLFCPITYVLFHSFFFSSRPFLLVPRRTS